MKTLLALILLLCVVSCSPQKNFARQLKGTDRVIFATTVFGDAFSITVTGDEAKKIIQALANARRLSPNVSCSPGSRLEFFKGSEHLASITNCVSCFWIGQTPYEDKTDTLTKLNEKCREEYIDLKSR